MEPAAEDNSDNLIPWSGSDGSQELCATESLADSYYDDDASDAEYPLDPPPARKSPEHYQPHDWETTGEQQSLPELSGSEEDASYREEDDTYLSGSRELTTESPGVQTPPTSLSPHPEYPDPEQPFGQRSQPHSHSSSSSLGCAADMTLALTLTTDQPQRASNRQGPEILNMGVESSEEGGSSEAPPASVSFGILDEGAEQAEKWNSESDTDLYRPISNRARCTRISHNESQSERQAKENRSKCKRIARLLTNAPNPQNKGALLFKKRQQRVEKFTLVSYGTGDNKLDGEDQGEKETEEVRSAEYNLFAASESELEEEYSGYQEQPNLSPNWGSVREMEVLPGTKGKGVLMFAQRRKRIDQIVSEHEELRSQGIPVEKLPGAGHTAAQNIYDAERMYVNTEPANYMDVNRKQQVEYQEDVQQIDQLSNVLKPFVPNRTAKPFLGLKNSANTAVVPAGITQASKKHELIFKVPVYTKTNPQVWSPTGDIIASRDERISVPAIKTGVLAEPKRRVSGKQSSMLPQDIQYQNKGERRSYIEPEEDCFSLGAEACNFMQPRTVKLKNPPPVAPKPSINPSCPPWMRRSPSSEPLISPRSPVSQPRQSPHTQHYLQQKDWAQPQQTANHWAPDQTQATLQTPADAWAPVNPSSQPSPLPTTNSWNQHPLQVSVSMHVCSPTYSPHHPPSSRSQPDSAPHSVASCPPEAGKSYGQPSKALQASPKGLIKGRADSGPTVVGKGTELFDKRPSLMEKVGAETGQANNAKSASPALSLPNHWRYSSNVRAPPPISYNPILAPFYPPSATKQPPSTSPKIKPKTKPKAPPKQLNTLDIMKHQPYQLDTSLFKYDAVPEAKSPSPRPGPASKFEATKNRKNRYASHSTSSTSELAVQSKVEVPAKSAALGFGRRRSLSLNAVPSAGLLSPVSMPGIHSPFPPTQRQTPVQDKVYKLLSPWEAASRSPIGSVDEAFMFQSHPSSVASHVMAAGHRRALPEPPEEWKRRVSLGPAAVGPGVDRAAPAPKALAMNRTFPPEKRAFLGPPFRPAQPLMSVGRTSIGYMAQGSNPAKYSPLHSAVQ